MKSWYMAGSDPQDYELGIDANAVRKGKNSRYQKATSRICVNGVMREAEIILLCVRWYLRYSLSYRNLEEMMAERGHAARSYRDLLLGPAIYPELEKPCWPHLKATNDSWCVDETYIKIKGTWTYLYRVVDSQGNTLVLLLSPTRDADRGLQTLRASKRCTPRLVQLLRCARSRNRWPNPQLWLTPTPSCRLLA
jgi:transposase, IS6 family